MRTVTRTLLTTAAMLIGVAAAGAQAPGPRPAVLIIENPASGFACPARFPAAVIERLMSFDVNADDRISRDELPERMQGLVARSDRDGDAALDLDDIHALVHAASSGPTGVSFRSHSSEGLPGVIRDLKLPPAKHQRALVIVGTHKLPRAVNAPAILEEMKALLDAEEYENFLAAATRLSSSADIRFRTGVGGCMPQPPVRR